MEMIESLQAKRSKIFDEVAAGKYYSRLADRVDDPNDVAESTRLSITRFNHHCERLYEVRDIAGPMSIVSVQFTNIVSAARCFVYLGWLVERLHNGEDPRAMLMDIMKNG